jgi:hypothetical protein
MQKEDYKKKTELSDGAIQQQTFRITYFQNIKFQNNAISSDDLDTDLMLSKGETNRYITTFD